MATWKDQNGEQISFTVTFLDGRKAMTVYTESIVLRFIRDGGVRAVSEVWKRWHGSHDDGTRGYEVLAHVGPMSPRTFSERVRRSETLEAQRLRGASRA